MFRRIAFCLGKPALGADQQHRFVVGLGLIMQSGCAVWQQNIFGLVNHFDLLQPVHDVHRLVYLRQHIAAALFAGRDGDLLPMIEPLFSAFGGQPRHAAIGRNRLDFRDTQLGRFLDYPIHFFTAGERLREQCMQWGFTLVPAFCNAGDGYMPGTEIGNQAMARVADPVEDFNRVPGP